MRRLFSAALACLLAILCLADITLWLRGYSTGDSLRYYWPRKPSGCRFIDFQTAGGRMSALLAVFNPLNGGRDRRGGFSGRPGLTEHSRAAGAPSGRRWECRSREKGME